MPTDDEDGDDDAGRQSSPVPMLLTSVSKYSIKRLNLSSSSSILVHEGLPQEGSRRFGKFCDAKRRL
jgi:hypothetical protein